MSSSQDISYFELQKVIGKFDFTVNCRSLGTDSSFQDAVRLLSFQLFDMLPCPSGLSAQYASNFNTKAFLIHSLLLNTVCMLPQQQQPQQHQEEQQHRQQHFETQVKSRKVLPPVIGAEFAFLLWQQSRRFVAQISYILLFLLQLLFNQSEHKHTYTSIQMQLLLLFIFFVATQINLEIFAPFSGDGFYKSSKSTRIQFITLFIRVLSVVHYTLLLLLLLFLLWCFVILRASNFSDKFK